MRPEDIVFWKQAKEAVEQSRADGEGVDGVNVTQSTRTIAALRQLVQRNWDKRRVIAVIEGLATGTYGFKTPEPQMVLEHEINDIIRALLDADYNIKETARRLDHAIYRAAPVVRERLMYAYPELYNDPTDGGTEPGDR